MQRILAMTVAIVLLAGCDPTPQDAAGNAADVSDGADAASGVDDGTGPAAAAPPANGTAKTPAERAAEAIRDREGEDVQPPPAMITDPHPEPVPQGR